MAVIAPNTEIILLKVPLELDESNQLTFANATAQYNYFYGLSGKKTFDKYTYQRKDNTIKVEALIDDLYGYNYVMYRNTNHSSKWFYAFITDMQYVSDKVTSLTIKTDVWQTWQFALTYKPVLIDREHANTDTAGDNTLPEGLELGEFVANGSPTNFAGVGGTGMSDYCTVVEVSQIENEGESATLSYSWASGSHSQTPFLNSIDRGTIPLVLNFVSGAANTASAIIKLYDEAGLGESIINIYMLPKTLIGSNYHQINLTVTKGNTTHTFTGAVVPDDKSGVYDITTTNFTKPTTVNGYTPKNKKVLTWPFCYFNISNNCGTSIPFHYEDFSSTVSFKTEATFGVSGSTKTIPQNYKSISSADNALDYSVTGPKYPVCSWSSDSYTNWLTQNAVNMQTQWTSTIIAGAIGIGATAVAAGIGAPALGMTVGKAVMYGAAGGAIKAGGDLIGTAREQHLAKTQANMVPDQVKGNLSAGDFLWAKYRSPFTYIPMSIKAEYARCIDEYFSQFGYKCNRVKVPNVTGRTNWNYVKTIGCYIQADIPQDDLQEIKNMFDKGVTFWHNPSTFMDYSQSNAIVTP